MEQIDLDSWEDFEAEVQRLQEKRARASVSRGTSPFLFRGQSNREWELNTTLERRVSGPLFLEQYYRLISVAKPQIETFTDLSWDLPKLPELSRFTQDYDKVSWGKFPGYDYFVYLRHHEFPSPLLDWTTSPYIAAFFAFSSAESDRVAIYVFWEDTGHGKFGGSDSPQIIKLGPYVKSHPRHFLQQSQYTMCLRFDNNQWVFAPHDDVFSTGSTTQDRLWKLTIPSKERVKVLRSLDRYNLNSFSLFQSEEALLKTVAFREIELRDREL